MINRVPYPIDQALEVLKPFKRIVLIGARAPIGFFAYPDKPAILTAEGTQIIDLCRRGQKLFGRLSQCPFVTVAAIEGVCLGGGAELAKNWHG